MSIPQMNLATPPAAPASTSKDHHVDVSRRIDQGIRMTFLLSFLAMPLSYLTLVILAHTSSEAVGIFNGILLWAGFAQSFYYFGGNAVIIRFVPLTPPPKRFSFIVSYSVLTIIFTIVGVLPIAYFPHLLDSALGVSTNKTVFPALLAIALTSTLLQILLSALKASLELTLAQVLLRVCTVGSFILFGLFFVVSRSWFIKYQDSIITGVYIGLVLITLVAGTYYARRTLKPEPNFPRWFVPEGFWRFSGMTQLSSLLNFLSSRLDQILVLAYAGISGLGIYAVLSQLAFAIQTVSGFFLESMLPVMTNIMARSGMDAVRMVYSRGARLNQVIVTGCSLVLLCLGGVALSAFGGIYKEYWLVLMTLVLFTGLASNLELMNAYLLTALGKVELVLGCQLFQVVVFVVSFNLLKRGNSLSLWMLAIAQGIAMTAGLIATIIATRGLLSFKLRVPREFVAAAFVMAGTTGITVWAHPMGLGSSLMLLSISFILFFVLGGYRWPEIIVLVSLFRMRRSGNHGSKPEDFILSMHSPIPISKEMEPRRQK